MNDRVSTARATAVAWETLTNIKEVLNDDDPEFTDARKLLAIRAILGGLDLRKEEFLGR